jgi:hypothetical protein
VKGKKIGKFGLMEMLKPSLLFVGEMEPKFLENGEKTRLELETLNLTFIIRLKSLVSSLYIFLF